MLRLTFTLVLVSCACTVALWAGSYPSFQVSEDKVVGDTPGLHNVFRITDKLLSGSVPEGDTGFQTLQKLGVKTIITVDGAKPEVERAKKFGMRYVHLPIGYDGVSVEQGLRLAKAVRDLPGIIYMHCHHGKHRSPAAAVVVKLCLDEKCTVQTAVELMKRAGTDPKYLGLYAAPQQLRRPTNDELDKLQVTYPETASTGNLVQRMVEIDECWDHLKLIQKAGWVTPKEHADLDPSHEAVVLWEHYVELGRLPEVAKRPTLFKELLNETADDAKQLESALRRNDNGKQHIQAEKSFKALQTSCNRCHALFRDVPQK